MATSYTLDKISKYPGTRWRNVPDEAEISAKFIAVIQRYIYTHFLTFFNTFKILAPKLCVQRTTKTENVKKLLKKISIDLKLCMHIKNLVIINN